MNCSEDQTLEVPEQTLFDESDPVGSHGHLCKQISASGASDLVKEIAESYSDLPEDFRHQIESYTESPENGEEITIKDAIVKFVSEPMSISLDFFKAGTGTFTSVPGQFTDGIGELTSVLKRPPRNIDLVYDSSLGDYRTITDSPSVLFIGECPTDKDAGQARQLVRFDDNGPPATLDTAMKLGGIPASACYYTTASKFGKVAKTGAYPAKLIKFCRPFLLYEIMKLKPKVIVCLGNVALQALFGDKKKSLASSRGMVLSFKGIPVVPTVSPASFYYSQGGIEQFQNEIAVAGEICRSSFVIPSYDGISYPSRDYQYSDKVEDLERWVDEALAQTDAMGDRWIAVDTETGNDTGHPEDNYIITSQWSTKPNQARVFMVRGERGKAIHSTEDMAKICALHAKLFLDKNSRLVGHNLRYDVQQYLQSFGVNLVPFFPRYFDTMAAYHKLRFDKEKGLGHLTLIMTNMGPYWVAMEDWVEQNAGKKGLALFPGKKKQRFKHGYRDIIYKYLLPYAACDTDSTFRCFLKLRAELDLPGNEKLKDLFYKIDMPCNRFLHEIETNGMPVVPQKLHDLSDTYWNKIESLAVEIRQAVGWDEFNPGSPDHKTAFLFGGSGPFKNHEKIALVTAKLAHSLKADPVFTSGKFPKPWAKVPANERATTGIATDRRALKTLCGDPKYKEDKVLKLLSNYSEIVTFAKTFLAKPKLDEDIIKLEQEPDEEVPVDPSTENSVDSVDGDQEDAEADANYLYGKGLIACTRRDNRIVTNIDPLSETGRMKHRNPNMANLPKSKEANAAKVFGCEVPSVRDAFVARPGYVIMEADYSAAEVWTMAYLGDDKELLDLLLSGADIHTTNAKKFFNIGKELTDDEFKEKYKAKRVAAKAVLFSVAYGTGADGLAQRLTIETGKHFPVEDAEQAINGFLTTYTGVAAYLQRMKDDAIYRGYVETPFGRRRYFPGISKLGREAQSAAKREGPNMTIQGTVADMLNSAGDALWRFRYETELGREMDFKIMLAIHDAILVEVKEEYAPLLAQVLKLCMSDLQKIPVESDIFKAAKLYVDVECGPAWGDLHKLKTFDKKTPFVKWCEQNLSLLPPLARERTQNKLNAKKVA